MLLGTLRGKRRSDCQRCNCAVDADELLCVECLEMVALIECLHCQNVCGWLDAGAIHLSRGRTFEAVAGATLHVQACRRCQTDLPCIQIEEFGGAALVTGVIN